MPLAVVAMLLASTRPLTPAASVALLLMAIAPMPAAVLVPTVTVPRLMPRLVKLLLPFSTRLPVPTWLIEPAPLMSPLSVNTPGPESTMPLAVVTMLLARTSPLTPAASVALLLMAMPPDAGRRVGADRHRALVDAQVDEAVVAVQHQIAEADLRDRAGATDVAVQREDVARAAGIDQAVGRRDDGIGEHQAIGTRPPAWRCC